MRGRKHVGAVIAALALVAVGAVVAFAAAGGGAAVGPRMMGPRYAYRPVTPSPVRSLASARSAAQRFADRLGLRVDEVMQFERNYYAKLVDRKGDGATEVLVDPASGAVSIEYGPAMMWNTRYGMHAAGAAMMGTYGRGMMRPSGNGRGMMGGAAGGGMMSGAQVAGAPAASGPVSLGAARTLAQRWLDANEAGVRVETGGDAFPGYFTFELLTGGRISGMLSVNASSGAVWRHWWHGAFVAMSA